MNKQPNGTVIVVGAGASHEFGLPVGTQLQDQISTQTRMNVEGSSINSFSHNGSFLDLLPSVAGLSNYTVNDQLRLARKSHHISEGVKHAASIDNYLHAHRSDAELVSIGKLAISSCILKAEHASSLAYGTQGEGFKSGQISEANIEPHNSWIGLLMKNLSAGRDFREFCKALSSISFVCFNYDRCIERYFFGAASLIYPEVDFDVEALESSLMIIHPYGSLGDLRPEQGRNGTFGKCKDESLLLSASRNIRTFTEGMESDVKFRIGDAFVKATNAIFLGYGFIAVNDGFLFDESPFETHSVLGTTYGISDERAASISEKLTNSLLRRKTARNGWQQSSGSPQLRKEGCADLIQRFSHLIEKIGC